MVKTGGILKSYAKIPVEVKNMLPSNVAYKQLYDVWMGDSNMCNLSRNIIEIQMPLEDFGQP